MFLLGSDLDPLLSKLHDRRHGLASGPCNVGVVPECSLLVAVHQSWLISSASAATECSMRLEKDLEVSFYSGQIGLPKVTVVSERLGRNLPFLRIEPVPLMCTGTIGTWHFNARYAAPPRNS